MAVSDFAEVKVPRRMAWRVMISKKISTMFSQDQPNPRQCVDLMPGAEDASASPGVRCQRCLVRC